MLLQLKGFAFKNYELQALFVVSVTGYWFIYPEKQYHISEIDFFLSTKQISCNITHGMFFFIYHGYF